MNFTVTLKHMHTRFDLVYKKLAQEQKIIVLQHTIHPDVPLEVSKCVKALGVDN